MCGLVSQTRSERAADVYIAKVSSRIYTLTAAKDHHGVPSVRWLWTGAINFCGTF